MKRKQKQGSNVNLKYEALLMPVKPERRLRVRRIRPQTLIQYSEHVQEVHDWCKQCRKSVASQRQVDIAMATYFNLLFEDGASQNVASYTLFGWIAYDVYPWVQKGINCLCLVLP